MFRVGDLLNGSGMRGVTGLSASDGKSSMLGDSNSGVPGRGDPNPPGPKGLILKFFKLFLRSYSLDPPDFSFFVVPVLTGGIGLRDASGRAEEEAVGSLAVSEDPVRNWTTCLKEEASAWTKVVGYGLFGSDLATGSTGGRGDCAGRGDGAAGVAGPLQWVVLLVLLLELLLLWVSGEEDIRGISEGSIAWSASRERNTAAGSRVAGK
ncbi:unnamed protein product [Cuscuta campestris]|uniref:Uncharacterized protein n=1 Tax=Cuscuta campestris TaxID=132261 RepID=A0A484K0F5_9ASTE|nr:unnamed protein product [Cuscuta campestris]